MNPSRHRAGTEASWHDTILASSMNPAENYERYFVPTIGGPLAEDLIEHAALRPGERVLDVACGTGIVTRLAANNVGGSGRVAGLDLNPAMLAVARAASKSPAIDWHEASAESMPLDDASFDVVLCQLGLQFVQDKPAALREMRRVLVPGGRLVMNVPGPTPLLFVEADQAIRRHLGPEAAGFISAVFSLHEPDEIESLLTAAGFHDVTIRRDAKKLSLPAPQKFLWQYLLSTPLAGPVANAPDEARTALEKAVVEKWEPFVTVDGMILEHGLTTATGRN